MIEPPSRRSALLAIAIATTALWACAPGASTAAAPGDVPARDALAEMERTVGGRVGVYALDTASGRSVAHREDERFCLASTFKWALVAAVLHQADRGALSLDERIAYGRADLLDNAPVTARHVDEGSLSLQDLARAAVTVSDNTAANLLLGKVGGPAGLTAFFRQAGDRMTRLDRSEPALGENAPGDVRDTTSPRAMVGLVRSVLCGDVLSPGSRGWLLNAMRKCETGRRRLRAGLPGDWDVGDKTGTGNRGALNDVAIALPPGRAPILIAAYLSDGGASGEELEAVQAKIARHVAAQLS